jgi:hypothetical protein
MGRFTVMNSLVSEQNGQAQSQPPSILKHPASDPVGRIILRIHFCAASVNLQELFPLYPPSPQPLMYGILKNRNQNEKERWQT